MGACMSSNAEEEEQKKRSQMIDRALEEDSKKLRRECKILLLGRCYVHSGLGWRLTYQRIRREWEINDRQADEDYTPERLYGGGIIDVSDVDLQESGRLCEGFDRSDEAI